MTTGIERWRFTAVDFYTMGKVGILGTDDRVELIDGEVRRMAPITPSNAAIVKRLNRILHVAAEKYIVSIRSPVDIDRYNQPCPNVAVCKYQTDFYYNAHPTPLDTRLVIEASDSMVDQDRSEKVSVYARARIPEAWIVDVAGQRILQCLRPNDFGYATVNTFQRGDVVVSHAVDGFQVQVNEIV